MDKILFGSLSKFHFSSDKVWNFQDHSLIFLHQNEKLYFFGTVLIRVLKGSINILGKILEPSSKYHTLYSPSTSSAISIEPNLSQKNQNILLIPKKEEIENDEKEFLDRLKDKFNEMNVPHAVAAIVLKKNAKMKYGIGSIPSHLKSLLCSPFKEDSTVLNPFHIPFFFPILKNSAYQGINIPEEWSQIGSTLINANQFMKIMVHGSKSSGKSTFLRYITNSLLNKFSSVLWFETDIGQPEFTPPGLVSFHIIKEPIFGPPPTHLRAPEKACFIGAVTPINNPQYYMESIFYLWNSIKEISQPIPIVINTQGWIKGLGKELLTELYSTVQPTYIVNIKSEHLIVEDEEEEEEEDIEYDEKVKPTVFNCNPLSLQLSLFSSSADKRSNSFLQYFGSSLSYSRTFKIEWNWLKIKIMHEFVPNSQLLYALNGTIIGLCVSKEKYSFVSKEQENLAKELDDPPLQIEDLPVCECIGLGVIRVIDAPTKTFYITTPVSLQKLEEVNLIMKGEMELPSALLLSGQIIQEKTPYLTTSSLSKEGSGSGEMKSRNNLKRKSLQNSIEYESVKRNKVNSN